jgi:hypothetical protein
VATTVKPRSRKVPRGAEFPSFLGADPRKHFRLWYGSVYRFDPLRGGTFEVLAKEDRESATHWGHRQVPMRVKGALWEYYGISPLPQSANCECVLARMDADGFGRLFIPDTCGFAVRVLDGAGNLLNVFGSYGNSASRGPGSAVPEPAIPLWGPQKVAVVDGHAAVVDRLNRRIVEVELKYRSETFVDVP